MTTFRSLVLIFASFGFCANAQNFHVGGTMVFVDYLERECGVVFKEKEVPTDPYATMKRHGASIVRLTLSHPPFRNSYSPDVAVDWGSKQVVFRSIDRAYEAGLETLLTFHYVSVALEDDEKKNPYVAPLAWQPIAHDVEKLIDSVYNHTYNVLNELGQKGKLPSIVSISNESTFFILTPNVEESELGEYDPERSVRLLNAGAKAVRDISEKYSQEVKVSFHMTTPVISEWWLKTHSQYNPDMDILGLSIYFGWYKGDHAGYGDLGNYIKGISSKYDIDVIVMETAQLFQSNGYDSHTNILGPENIPFGYPNPPTTITQKEYMIDLANEVKDAGGVGVIYWGGEWVGTDCYIFPNKWGIGSSWENKTFWDEGTNVHDGINWMAPFTGSNSFHFSVNMTDQDVAGGVFIIGDLPNKNGESWTYIEMDSSQNGVYTYETTLPVDAKGRYAFSNGRGREFHEKVLGLCSTSDGFRDFEVSSRLDRNSRSFVWEQCNNELVVLSSNIPANDKAFTVFPNPVRDGYLHIRFLRASKIMVTLTSLSGRYLLQSQLQSDSEERISVKDVAPGMYFLEIIDSSDHKIYHHKIIIE